MKKFAIASIVASVAATLAGPASAVTINVDSYTNVTPPADTRANGSATDSAVTIDGTNSTVKIVTINGVDSTEKAAPFFYAGTLGTAIGTLGDLGRGGLTADWRLESRGNNTPSYVANIAAFRVLVDGPTPGSFAEIIWEAPNQSPIPAFTAGVDYDNVEIGSGKFWSRYNGQNYGQGDNGPVNTLTLAALASGGQLTPTSPTFSDSTAVYGLQVSIGSAAGDYTAYVGDINATFTAVPEPTTLAVVGLGVLGLLRRRVIRD